MLTEVESVGNLLEVAEGKCYLELLFSFPLPCEVVVKYEEMRERTFKKVGLFHSSSKIWRLQNEANQKAKLKSNKPEENERIHHEYIERLSFSHDITLRFGRIIEEILISLDKVSNKMCYLLENNSRIQYPFQSKVQELETIHYKDISKFKEMESDELRLLDVLFQRYSDKEQEIIVGIENIDEKLVYYERSIQGLEGKIDSILFKHQSEKNELEARMQELLARCSSYSEQKEHSKLQSQTGEKIDILYHESRLLSMQNAQFKAALEEAAKNEKKKTEKYSEEISTLENEFKNLAQEVASKEKENERLKEKLTQIKEENLQYKLKSSEFKEECVLLKNKLSEVKEEYFHYKTFVEETSSHNKEVRRSNGNTILHQKIRETLSRVKEITHEVFVKYEKSQQEWEELRWKNDSDSEHSEVLDEIEFLAYMLNKLANDNNWLVDRMAELGKENYQLREDGKSSSPSRVKEDTIIDLKAASSAMKGFEQARNKLLSQFSEAKKGGNLKY